MLVCENAVMRISMVVIWLQCKWDSYSCREVFVLSGFEGHSIKHFNPVE
uniref:Uncharacterized protein n=1 Tax=Anguilla anguilla TaxID=7936 RepID=A0A0E9RY99_ANGAN